MLRFVGRWFITGYCVVFLSMHVADLMRGKPDPDWLIISLWVLLLLANMVMAIRAQVRASLDAAKPVRDPKQR